MKNIKRCPRIKTCALFPDICPEGQGDDYKKCVLIKKEK